MFPSAAFAFDLLPKQRGWRTECCGLSIRRLFGLAMPAILLDVRLWVNAYIVAGLYFIGMFAGASMTIAGISRE
jgi:hypothetical protein